MRVQNVLARGSFTLVTLLSACAHDAVTARVATTVPASTTSRPSTRVERLPRTAASPLAFSDLFEEGTSELRPSARALAVNGQRVRMVGFMAKLEIPIERAFYLTPRPVVCDEAGGGTADLPPNSVLVSVSSLRAASVPYVEGGIEVDGRFELGNRVDDDGRAAAFRILVDATPSDRLRGQEPSDDDGVGMKKEAGHGR